MAEWAPQPKGGRVEAFNSYTSGDGVINSSASANVKGSYETMVASTGRDYDGLFVKITPTTFTVRDVLMDIAIGAAAAEQIILANLLAGQSSIYEFADYFFPISIPAGTRLSARIQASTGSAGAEVLMHGLNGSFDGEQACSRVETWGANTGDSGATSIDPGATLSTPGAYSQLVAASAFDVKWIMVAFGNQANGSRTTMVGDADIAIGAGGSEQIIVQSIRFACHANTDSILPHTYGPIPVAIKAGSRVAARCTNYSTNASPARLIDMAVYGIG